LPDKHWKVEERAAARLLGGERCWANSGRRVDVEGPGIVAQVKHRRVCSLAELERLALELEALGCAQGKIGVVVVKRRAGAGRRTPRLVVCTEEVWRSARAGTSSTDLNRYKSPGPGYMYGHPVADHPPRGRNRPETLSLGRDTHSRYRSRPEPAVLRTEARDEPVSVSEAA
jgi:hypothetical protein